MFALAFRFLLLRTMAIGCRRPDLKDSTLRQYHGDFGPSLNRGPVHTRYAGGPRLFNAPSVVLGTTRSAPSPPCGDGPQINIAHERTARTYP